MMKLRLLLIILMLTGPLVLKAQTGVISGTLRDSTSGEGLFGAVVFVQENGKAVAADMDGKFQIKVEPGKYTLKVSFIGYQTKIMKNVVVHPSSTTQLYILLNSSINDLNEIQVVAVRKTHTESAVINEIKKSEQVATGVSADQIAKTQDRDAAQVMQRIPGITIVDNRFVMVRGLSERYNNVMINDAISPSTEIDTRSFSFDLIPSSVIDRMVIYKSGAAELPGDFAGAVIKVYTKNNPTENTTSISYASSIRPGTTFSKMFLNKGEYSDLLGYDNGLRQLPGNFPASLSDFDGKQSESIAHTLNNNFKLTETTAIPDSRLNISLSRTFKIKNSTVGNITSVSYSNASQYFQARRYRYQEFDEQKGKSPLMSDFIDNSYSNNVRIGIIHNWSLILGGNHKFEFKNIFNQLGENETIIREGVSIYQRPDDFFRNYSFHYTSRGIYSGQLTGTHEFNSHRTSFKWVSGISYINRNEPDYKRFRTYKSNEPGSVYRVVIPPGPTTFDAARFYSDLHEGTGMFSGSFEHKFSKDADSSGVIFRSGFYSERKSRDYSARWFSYTYPLYNNQQKLEELITLPVDQIFSNDNVKNKDGFRLREGTNPSDKYTASNTLLSTYAALSVPVTKKITASGGMRVEYNHQQLSTNTHTEPVNVDNPVMSCLPFINLNYSLNKKMMLRAAYSNTVNRPEFRELAPMLYYNFEMSSDNIGNPKLKSSSIHNYDLRWEMYPGPAELITVGVFYKKFINPIESYIRQGADNPIFTFDNALYAQNFGMELEIRKSLAGLTKNPVIDNFSVLINTSVINSKVDLGSGVTSQAAVRPLQGQSPYVVNTGLYYVTKNKSLTVSALYNVIGKRIYIVGDNINPTVYEMPRHVIDLNIAKSIGKKLELKAGVQDLLNYKASFIQDSNLDSRITNVDETFFSFRRGSYYTIGLTFKL